MFPFWRPVIAPLLTAAGARRVVEVGALRGDNTRQIIEHLGPDSVLHVVDPVPGFDPSEHEREFPGRYVFHQALSLDVLGTLPPMDAALIDGDHNWYTVLHELRLLRQVSRAAKAPLPVLVLHDVGWPYGRRDLYYAPDTIPAEHRQPHRQAGMRPGRPELQPDGEGMSPGLWNAELEGGPRNGVLTGLEDFLAEHDRPVRTVVLPLYFGLAVVVEEERLRRQPALAAELDRIEGAAASRGLLELGERLRVGAMAHHHTVVRQHTDRHRALADRYLDRVVADLAAGDEAERERLGVVRRALADLEAGGSPGAVVVAGGDAVVAALAAAHLATATEPRPLRVVDPSPDGAVALAGHLARLDLTDVDPVVTATLDAEAVGAVALVLDTTGAASSGHPDGGGVVVLVPASGRAAQH